MKAAHLPCLFGGNLGIAAVTPLPMFYVLIKYTAFALLQFVSQIVITELDQTSMSQELGVLRLGRKLKEKNSLYFDKEYGLMP